MKFMDKKGRIFGRVNIIDATIVILLSITVLIYAGLIRKTASVDKFYQRETINMKCYAFIPPEIISLVKIGDRSTDTALNYHATLNEIEKINPNDVMSINTKSKTPINYFVWFTLNAFKADGELYYKRIALKPGRSFNFETKDYLIGCYIVEIKR